MEEGLAKVWTTSSIDDHIVLIKRQVDRSMQDPETRRLAGRIVSGVVDWWDDPSSNRRRPVITAWGRMYDASGVARCPSRKSLNRPPNVVSPDELCEMTAVWNFVVQNVRYVADPDGYDFYQTIRRTLESGAADCDDFVITISALLRSLGYQVFYRVVSMNGREWQHIYLVVRLPKGASRWSHQIVLDPTEPGKPMGWEYPNPVRKRDFT